MSYNPKRLETGNIKK